MTTSTPSFRPRPRGTLTRRALTASGLLIPVTALAACSDPVPDASADGAGDSAAASDGGGETAGGVDTSGDEELIRSSEDPEIAALVPAEIAETGTLTVGFNGTGTAPLSFLADDNETFIGSEIDVARLVADKLGLELDLQQTTWENWPLKLEAGEFDVVHANVGINEERLEKFDFASYRAAFMAFLAQRDAEFFLEDIESISGRIIAVGNATNQERILTDWNAQLESEGEEPAELKNYSTDADTLLALGSGRIDAYLSPYASLSFIEARREDFELQGTINAGWPDETLVAGTFPRGSGLAEAYAAALNALIEEGTYSQVLDRWRLGEEALAESRAHTKENP